MTDKKEKTDAQKLADAVKTQEKLNALKVQREKLDKQIRSAASKVGAAERQRKNRQKYIVGGAILAILASEEGYKEADKKLITRLLAAKISDDDKKVLSDLITFESNECRALDYIDFEAIFSGAD